MSLVHVDIISLITATIPLDCEPCDPRLLSQNIPPDFLDNGLSWRVLGELWIRVLIVDVVSNAHKLSIVVAAAKEDNGDADNLGVRDAGDLGRFCFEDEFVYARRDGPNEEAVKFLVMFGATSQSAK
jgi:hypothetical protein